MGKKGTKRKTKWRALPLGEEAGGSGNEEELHDDDQSTTSSVVGQSTAHNFQKPQTPFYKAVDRSYRTNRRFSYEKNKIRGPLVKLESKTFDEEEYTKITTPRQDVLFKKGYFGRKRESSSEKNVHHVGEMEEEPIMDQIIITNGFVDERGHYLVNGNSYEIYDPYSNTVTVVVGPPPYTNGVTQPVLAAVSCQPVPLQPVDWYPPGSDWPAQGSAWTPLHTAPATTTTTTAAVSVNSAHNSENLPNFHPAEGQISNLYQPSAYVIPNYIFGESPIYNSEMVHENSHNHVTEFVCSTENNRSKDEETSITNKGEELSSQKKDSNDEGSSTDSKNVEQNSFDEKEKVKENGVSDSESFSKTNNADLSQQNSHVESQPEMLSSPKIATSEESSTQVMPESIQCESPKVEKQSHSTQTNSIEAEEGIVYSKPEVPNKESHSTQTLPEIVFKDTIDFVSNNKRNDITIQNANKKNEIKDGDTKETCVVEEVPQVKSQTSWKGDYYHRQHLSQEQQSQYSPQEKYNGKNFHSNSMPKKSLDDSFKKIYQKRTNFSEERKFKVENSDTSPFKISYAKKAMEGLEKINSSEESKVLNSTLQSPYHNKMSNGWKNAQNNHLVNGTETGQQPATNGINRTIYQKQVFNSDKFNSYEDKKCNQNENFNNGFLKPRSGKTFYGKQTLNAPSSTTNTMSVKDPKDFKSKEKKFKFKALDSRPAKSQEVRSKPEGTVIESPGFSEKSSTASELSSPTELSSGQNTPPEKLIVRKMEQKIANEINKSFEEKLKQNFSNKTAEAFDSTKEKENVVPQKEKSKAPKVEEETQQNYDALNKNKRKMETGRKNNVNTISNSSSGSNIKKGKADKTEKAKEVNQSNGKKKKKKTSEITKDKSKTEELTEENTFLPNLIMQEPQKLIFRTWEGMKNEEADFISKMDTILPEDNEILKTLGLNEDKANFSKLPLHSDLLMMLPAFGWSRPKFKIEDMFTSTKQLQNDLFTRRNIIGMKSTKPEEFFASVIDSTSTVNKIDKAKKEGKVGGKNNKDQQQSKQEETKADKNLAVSKESKSPAAAGLKKTGNNTKAAIKVEKNMIKGSKTYKKEEDKETEKEQEEKETKKEKNGMEDKEKKKLEENEKEKEKKKEIEEKKNETKTNKTKGKKLGIVEAVNSWLQEQENSENVLSVDSLQVRGFREIKSEAEGNKMKIPIGPEPELETIEPDSKNEVVHPMHALFAEKKPESIEAMDDMRSANNECIGVVESISTSGLELKPKVLKKERKQRSSSLDGSLSQQRIKKHLKYLSASASFCQDFITDVRNGLPVRSENATEELCDPRQSVFKYYTLSPQQQKKNNSCGRSRQENEDVENEVFDALEYKFLTKVSDKKISDEMTNGLESIANNTKADSVSCKDANFFENKSYESHKDAACKLQ